MKKARKPSPTESPLLFEIDPEPLPEKLTALGGVPLLVQTFRSLGLPATLREHVRIKQRERGHDEATMVESFVVLNALGGECRDDFERLREDPGLSELIGHEVPSPAVARKFLNWFHEEEKIEEAKQRRTEDQIAYIPEENEPPGRPLGRAEMNVVLADEFRDGNVCARMAPLTVAKKAFAALPETVTTYYYRGDSACHESGLINWPRKERREEGPQGFIGFAISARMSEALHKAIGKVPEEAWVPYGKPHAVEIRECAEVSFVPGEKSGHKDTQPLRYIAIRIRQRQESQFSDGGGVKHFAVVSDIREWKAGRLIEWHREKAGTIEGVHDVLKNELGAGVMPSKYFGANAAWLRMAAIAHDVMTARPKRLRFLIFNTPGRLVHHARRIVLRLAEWLEVISGGRRVGVCLRTGSASAWAEKGALRTGLRHAEGPGPPPSTSRRDFYGARPRRSAALSSDWG
ncbi:MAG: hypothetical protein Q8N47_22085 [Bryobacterales bacterium]|nr:hypothetical protein [Bryobacterales bacterium]